MANSSRQIAWPFRIGPTGGVDYVEDQYQAATQRLRQLILTNLGERPMRPTYGTPAQSFLFESNSEVVGAELALRLQTAIRQWEPDLRIHSVFPSSNPLTGELTVTVSFSVPPSQRAFTTVVGVGGTLTEGLTL